MTLHNTFGGSMQRYDDVRDNNAFFVEIMFILEAKKHSFERSYDKYDITLVVVSCEI